MSKGQNSKRGSKKAPQKTKKEKKAAKREKENEKNRQVSPHQIFNQLLKLTALMGTVCRRHPFGKDSFKKVLFYISTGINSGETEENRGNIIASPVRLWHDGF